MSSCPDCIFEIHELWPSGFSRVYSSSCCSCSFEPEIIKNGQSSHKMYSNKILNVQESATILNACTKKSGNLLKVPRIYIYIYIYIYIVKLFVRLNWFVCLGFFLLWAFFFVFFGGGYLLLFFFFFFFFFFSLNCHQFVQICDLLSSEFHLNWIFEFVKSNEKIRMF